MKNFAIKTLCDYAQINNGKLTIVGTFNRITTKQLPFVHQPGFSIVVRFSTNEQINEEFIFSSYTPSGKKFMDTLQQTCAITNVKGEEEKSFDFCVNIANPIFAEEGTYLFKFAVGGCETVLNLYVEQKKE